MEPYLQISVISTCEANRSHKQILKRFKDRFERVHKISGQWLDVHGNLVLELIYPSIDRFVKCYHSGFDILSKLAEDKQFGHLKLREIFTKAIASKNMETDNPHDKNYVVVKYQTNYIKPMRVYYQFVSNVARLLGIMYSIEEIENGFLLFFQRKIDLIGAQLDPTNYDEVKEWIQFLNIDLKEESIQKLLEYIKSLETRSSN